MRPTPAAMKIARMMSAPRIPQNRTLCWWIGGTWKKRKIRRKTKRLSTLSESSMTYPVTNSSAGVRPCQKKIDDRENGGQRDPGHAPDQGFAKLYGVGATVEHTQVEHQHGEDEKIK